MDSAPLLLAAITVLLLSIAGMLVVLVRRHPEGALPGFREALDRLVRDEQQAGRAELRQQLDSFSAHQERRIEGLGERLELLRTQLAEEQRLGRAEGAEQQRLLAESLGQRLADLTQRNEQRLGELRTTLEQQLKSLQADNAQKLEQMRATVDEKLHATLETRLTESFGNVATMLARVDQGLGEMNKLATDVGGLQRVLSNVKSRGVFGEVQLAGLLEQVLAPDQFASNVATIPGSGERVEFAVRFPGSSGEAPVWLPIDSKFPREDYERLLDAQERSDPEAARAAGDALERRVRLEAKRICDKYVGAPYTTEFAILFLPTEGLYAEVLRRPGLVDGIQRECKIAIAGPTTLLALMTSFQMGFRTLAIQERSSEVWRTLGAVKTEFGKFGGVLDSVQKKLQEASNKIEETSRRSRVLSRKLRDVEALPVAESQGLLGIGASDEDEDPV